MLFVKINTVTACVRKNSVENNPYAQFMCRLAKAYKISLISKHRVDFLIVAGVVAVV